MKLVLTAIDNNPHYQDHLKAFLMSMRMNSPGLKVRACLINCSDEYSDSIEKAFDVEVARIFFDHPTSPSERNYIRHFLFSVAFKQKYESVAWIDNDALVMNKLGDDFWENATGSSIKVWLRPKKNDKYKFQAGVYILGNTALTQGYVKDIMEQLKDTDDWMLPQLLLYTLSKKHYIAHHQLCEKYNDSKFCDNSTIWHCKQSHFKEEKFQKEFKHYLKKANILCRS